MNKTMAAIVTLLAAFGVTAICLSSRPPAYAAVQERENAQDVKIDEADFRTLERRLDQVRGQLERAEESGDRPRIEELRRLGERLLDRLEELERAREDEEEDESGDEGDLERHLLELEMERMHLEMKRLRQEIDGARQEASFRLARTASDGTTSAAYAISRTTDLLEGEVAVEFLTEMYGKCGDPTLKRMIGHHLVAVHHELDSPNATKQWLRELILNR